MQTKVIIVGAAGRIGKRFITLAAESGEFEIVGAIDLLSNPDFGKDAGLAAGISNTYVTITDTFPMIDSGVVVDFSLPEALDKNIDFCTENGIALVSGTTGLSEGQKERIKDASRIIPILYTTNLSVGMNVLFSLAGKVATMLGDEYDIEIIEQHHRFKKDAPSGSALTIAEKICDATERDYPGSLVFGRSGIVAQRQKGEIGIHAIRAGDITGMHSVMFACLGETFALNHTAQNRDTFIRGALRAAKWIAGKEPALYSMADVLGLVG